MHVYSAWGLKDVWSNLKRLVSGCFISSIGSWELLSSLLNNTITQKSIYRNQVEMLRIMFLNQFVLALIWFHVLRTHVQDLLAVCLHVVQLVLEVRYGGVLLSFHLLALSFLSPQLLLTQALKDKCFTGRPSFSLW